MTVNRPERRAGLALLLVCLLSLPVPAAPAAPAGSVLGPAAPPTALAGRRAVLISPEAPKPGGPLRVLAAFEADAAKVRLSLRGPAGEVKPVAAKRGGGPPYWVAADFAAAPAGSFAVVLAEGREEVEVDRSGFLDVAKGWSWASERLYAAWIEALFADADERSSWKALHDVTRDPGRNILHDHLGLGEDEASGRNALDMIPDCADNPYFLRAYFAWKLGLPFGFHETSWGTLESPPFAGRLIMAETRRPRGQGNPVPAMSRFLSGVRNIVHAGNGRTALRADGTDYYPLPLSRRALKPGTVYADPYGHTYTLVRWVDQTRKKPGLLLGAAAQPDGTIGVKRFWKGNFLFTTEDVVGEPGFKAFRPLVIEAGRPRLLTNGEIAASPDYGDFSLQQEKMPADDFYAAMEKLINPEPLDAEASFEDLFQALHEQLLVRVDSVANGEAYMTAHPGTVIPMPSGKSVFQSLGPWEDYSTPNRDLRLLIAIDTILEFPDKVARNPAAFEMGRKTPDAIRRELLTLQHKRAAALSIAYKGSDGSSRVLTLEDIFRRKDAFEMGYNPNDSIEIRWGAPAGSAELKTARRHSPASQIAKMKDLQPWFHKRLRPAV
ncbi:MAG: hypothetical protein ACM32H_07400 [Candidatus Aminicenantes bacterium RBG_16_66_30]